MNCPKCGSMVIDDFGDERCFNCGRRPNAEPDRVPEPDEPIELNSAGRLEISRHKRSADEVIDQVMKAVRAKRSQPKLEEEEESMGSAMEGTCSKKNCDEPAAPNSVRCVKHRDEQRASNEAYRARKAEEAGKAAPKKRGRKPKASVPAIVTPKTAARTDGPAEISVLPPAGPDAVRGLDAAIERMRTDLASLERAREIIQRQSATL